MIVFECYNQNQYRIEWDTIFQLGGCCLSMPMSDFDNDGHNEFWARTYDGFSGYQKLAIYECYGDGIYKHRYLSSNVSFDLPFGIVLKDSVTINGITRRGLWGCFLDYENTIITQMRFDQKSSFNSTLSSYQFVEEPIGGIKVPGTYTSLAAEDFDNDGKIEIVIGGAGGHFVYLDSTGTGPYAMKGYELKDIYFNEPAGGSWLVSKDLDNDGRKEFIGCGVGLGTGSFCVIKHTGSPGSNQWAVKYWDTVGIVAMPFMGIDSGSIDNKFSILYPTIRYDGALDFLNLITFTKNGTYSFYKSFKMIKDSAAMFKAKFIDIDNDEKINILSPMFLEGPPWKNYLVDFEQVGTININPIGTEVPSTFNLYQNYPNPFNPSTKIKFAIPSDVKCETSEVKMVIYDITGKKITTLVNEKLNPGTYEVTFDGSNLPSGIYFYKLNAGNFSETKRMILIK
jgi:hypothetical protein